MDNGLLAPPTVLEAGALLPARLSAPDWFKSHQPHPPDLVDPDWYVYIEQDTEQVWDGHFSVPKHVRYQPGVNVHLQFAEVGVPYHGVAMIIGHRRSSRDGRVLYEFEGIGPLYHLA